jgi:hypothetical protein
MLLFVIQQALLSFILIFTVHYIYEFFKDNLTQPKVKDLVNKPKHKYREIYESIRADNNEQKQESKEIMKAELQDYLKELSSEKSNVTNVENAVSHNITSSGATLSDGNQINTTTGPMGMSLAGNELFDNNYQSL